MPFTKGFKFRRAPCVKCGEVVGVNAGRHVCAEERLRSGCAPRPGGCLLWHKSVDGRGYPQMFFRGRLRRAHRVAWELQFGPIPDGVFVCHSCDQPRCVNVAHLFLGTALDNSLDMTRKGRSWSQQNPASTHFFGASNPRLSPDGLCAAGHEMEYGTWGGRRRRICRVCDRLRHKK